MKTVQITITVDKYQLGKNDPFGSLKPVAANIAMIAKVRKNMTTGNTTNNQNHFIRTPPQFSF